MPRVNDTYCSACNSSDGCESLNTCQTCNSCQSCNENCNAASGCNVIQTFCSSAQSVGTFSFGQCVKAGEAFLKLSNWNKIFTFINDAYDEGNSSPSNKARSGSGVTSDGTGGDSGLPASETYAYMTASRFNDVADAIGGLGGPSRSSVKFTNPDTNTTSTKVSSGDKIYGSYFESLETYASSLKYKSSQCDDCNAGCNVQCNTCLLCNAEDNCGSCDGSCQSHVKKTGRTCESCNKCDNCQSTCEISCQNNLGATTQ